MILKDFIIATKPSGMRQPAFVNKSDTDTEQPTGSLCGCALCQSLSSETGITPQPV